MPPKVVALPEQGNSVIAHGKVKKEHTALDIVQVELLDWEVGENGAPLEQGDVLVAGVRDGGDDLGRRIARREVDTDTGCRDGKTCK